MTWDDTHQQREIDTECWFAELSGQQEVRRRIDGLAERLSLIEHDHLTLSNELVRIANIIHGIAGITRDLVLLEALRPPDASGHESGARCV